jgi:hypothetical protein
VDFTNWQSPEALNANVTFLSILFLAALGVLFLVLSLGVSRRRGAGNS